MPFGRTRRALPTRPRGQSLQRFYDPYHLVRAESLTASEVQQLSRPTNDRAAFGRARDTDTSTPTEFEKPFIAQKPESTQNRVGIDAEVSGQVFGGRQPLAGTRFSVSDGPPDLRGHLVMERQWVGSIDIDGL